MWVDGAAKICWNAGMALPSRFWGVPLLAMLLISITACGRGKPGAWDQAGYHVRGKVVWYLRNWTSQPFEVTGADAASFKYPLPNDGDRIYALDKARVYWSGQEVPGADPASFRIVDATFARDRKFIYFNTYVVCDDPDHFERISPIFVKNGHTVYTLSPVDRPPSERVFSKNAAAFRLLEPDGPMFFADGDKLVVAGTRFEDLRAADFVYLGDSYWRVGDRAFYHTEEMPEGTVAAKLAPLTGQYARDGKRVYYLGRVLEGADSASFTVTDPRWPRARDAQRDYDQGKAVERAAP